jgi:glycosyltransferase involved in cell wall biosynthesis
MPPRAEPVTEFPPPAVSATTRRLKLAFVYDALYPYQKGGAERRYHELAQRLRHRHEVHHITWQWWDGPAVVERDGVTLHGVARPPAMYGHDGKRTVREALAFSARLVPAVLRERFDVIDCSATPYLPLCAAFPSARVRSSPMVATWHEYWGEHWHEYLPGRQAVARIARATEWLSAPMADETVAVSRFTATELQRRLPRRAPPRVVENGVDLAAINAAPKARAGADVIFVGRLIDEKRVHVLLRAIALVRAEHPGVTCDIVGEGPERQKLEYLARELQLSENVRFLGTLDEQSLYGRLKAARVFALPSVREGFGIAVVEAQAAGAVPVVARAAYSAAPSLIDEGRTGLVCGPDAESFAHAIVGLLADDPGREGMAAAARAAAAVRGWDRIADEMDDVYQSVVARKERAAG